MRFKRLISMTLAVSLTLGVFSGLPPLKEVTSITKEAEAANGVHKAWNWGSRHEFVKYIKKNYAKTYETKFNADGGHTFGNVNLKETIDIPDSKGKDGKKSTTYRYWWFVTLDKYHYAHDNSHGENRRVNAHPTHKVGTGVWGTIQLVAKPKYDGSCNANSKKGFALDYIDIKGEKGKFKEDLGRTVSDNYGLSMYIIDLKDWMSNKGKYGYQKWSNTKENGIDDDTKKVTITMYLNAVTKTSISGGGDNDYHARGLNTKEKWKNATAGWPISNNPKEYDQHYNIPVEIQFEVEHQDVPRGYYYLESRMATTTNKYAKTFTNKEFAWGKNTGNIADKSKRNGGFYKKVEGNVKGTSCIKLTKDYLQKTGGNDRVLRGIRLERYAIDDPDGDDNGDIIRSSFTKSGYKYGDVAHVYLTCHKSVLQEMFKDSTKKTTEHSYSNKNDVSGSPDKNSVATLSKDHSVEVNKGGKAYTFTCEDGSAKKKTKTEKSKKKWVDQSYKDSDDDKKKTRINAAINAMKKDQEISYDQFLDYVSNICFQYFEGEHYKGDRNKPFQDHLVLIWERAVEPKLSMNTELVSCDSGDSTDSTKTDSDSNGEDTSGKYVGVTSGDYALDVPMNKMSDDYNVASTMDTLQKLVPSNNDLTLESFLKEKIKGLIKTGDKHDVGYYYNRLLYSTGDAVPAILSDIRVSYTDKSGTKIVKSRTD